VRAWALVATLLLCVDLSACGMDRVPEQVEDDQRRADSGTPWREITVDRSALVRGAPPGGLSISNDGRIVAVAREGAPINEIDVIDLVAKRRWVLAHSDPRVRLQDPALSKAGDRLAFVVTPPLWSGISEIWIANREGERVQVISSPRRFYSNPVFSADGKRLYFFRDVDSLPLEGAHPGRAELRQYHRFSIFEFDLVSLTERRLTDEEFSAPDSLYISAGGGALLFRALCASGGDDPHNPTIEYLGQSVCAPASSDPSPVNAALRLSASWRPGAALPDAGSAKIYGDVSDGALFFVQTDRVIGSTSRADHSLILGRGDEYRVLFHGERAIADAVLSGNTHTLVFLYYGDETAGFRSVINIRESSEASTVLDVGALPTIRTVVATPESKL